MDGSAALAWLEVNGIRCPAWRATLSERACKQHQVARPKQCEQCNRADPELLRQGGLGQEAELSGDSWRRDRRVNLEIAKIREQHPDRPVEVETMAKPCTKKGCQKISWLKGLCAVHFRERFDEMEVQLAAAPKAADPEQAVEEMAALKEEMNGWRARAQELATKLDAVHLALDCAAGLHLEWPQTEEAQQIRALWKGSRQTPADPPEGNGHRYLIRAAGDHLFERGCLELYAQGSAIGVAARRGFEVLEVAG